MFRCEFCEFDFKKESNLNFHKENLCKRFRCELCGTGFKEESDLNSHKKAVWCNECQEEWNCKYHNVKSRCFECDLIWHCDAKYDTHWNQEHKLECDICQSKFAKESTIKYHNQEWYCEACESNFVCYREFTDHASHLDHWLVKNLRPNWTAKIPLEAFEKVDEASADREHNVDDTLLKKLSYTQDQMKKSKIVQCTVRISQIMT